MLDKTIEFDTLKESYIRDGYVVVRGFVDGSAIAAMDSALKKVIAEKIHLMPPAHVIYEDPKDKTTLKQLQDLHLYEPFFSNILFNSKFEEIAETLMADKAVGKTVEYFNKPKKIGKATPPHQDAYYFKLDPPEAITMWLALEDVDEENGCVRYVKGSHLTGMRPHGRTHMTTFSQAITDYGKEEDTNNEVPIRAKPGDLLIHHAMTVHRADENKSETRSRRAMGLIYFAASAKEDKEAKEAYQRMLAAEKARGEIKS